MILREVGACSLLPGRGLQVGTLLRHSSEAHPAIQARPAALHGYACFKIHSTSDQCMQHWRITRHLGQVPEGPIFMGRSQRRRPAMVSSLKQNCFYFKQQFCFLYVQIHISQICQISTIREKL